MFLDYANTLWYSGHFYAAVLLYLPVQVAIVLSHNITLWIVLCCGNSLSKSRGTTWNLRSQNSLLVSLNLN